MWATGVKIPHLDESINSYLAEITESLKNNSSLISALKSSVTLFSQDPHQAKTHPRILIEDTSLSFNKHSSYVAERVSSRNNILNVLAATSWRQQKETLLMTYKAVGRSIINYAAPIWSTNLCDTNYRNIQYTQAMRISTGCHKMSSVDYLHVEAEGKGTLRATICTVFG